MALTFRQAMICVHQRATEVATLSNKGDPLSTGVINLYRLAWNDFHKNGQDENKIDPTLKANLISAVTDYLHRDMNISSLADLQSKYDHRVPGAKRPILISNYH